MRAVDTNILARFALHDDDEQAPLALRAISEPFWVPITVWLELGWLLDKRLGPDRGPIADALSTLATIDMLHTADADGIAWAIDRYRAGADWADMIHLVASRAVADGFVTFDRRLARAAGAGSPLPVETLG